MTRAFALVLTLAAPAFAETCESVILFPQTRCGSHPMIETRCQDGVLPEDRRFEGYAQHPDGTLQHVKVTCGDGDSYLTGYRHLSCDGESYAAYGTELSCCGDPANTAQFNRLCPQWDWVTSDMPCPGGCFP